MLVCYIKLIVSIQKIRNLNRKVILVLGNVVMEFAVLDPVTSILSTASSNANYVLTS